MRKKKAKTKYVKDPALEFNPFKDKEMEKYINKIQKRVDGESKEHPNKFEMPVSNTSH